MLKVRVSKVTSDYLCDELGVQPGVWYDATPADLGPWAKLKVPNHFLTELNILLGTFDGVGCDHLYDNEQTEWEVMQWG